MDHSDEDLIGGDTGSVDEEPPQYNTYDLFITDEGYIRFASENEVADLYKVTLPSKEISEESPFYGIVPVAVGNEAHYRNPKSVASVSDNLDLSESKSASTTSEETPAQPSCSTSASVECNEPGEAKRDTHRTTESDGAEDAVAKENQQAAECGRIGR